MAVNQSEERSRFLNRMIKDDELILGKDGEIKRRSNGKKGSC